LQYYNSEIVANLLGIGLRAEHYCDIIKTHPKIGWFEVHSENYFGKGGKPLHFLEKISQDYPLSLHGVGLSLGSADDLNVEHLNHLKKLTDRFTPLFVSEHLSWSSIDGCYLNDLLPLPYTEEALHVVSRHINEVQEYLNRQILIENISSYFQFAHSIIPEYEFITAVVQQTGCGILLDVNNLYVNSINHGWDTNIYLQNVSTDFVYEIHLAGFTKNEFADGAILIDTHNQFISNDVWELYQQTLQCMGPKPTLIEWDKDLPGLPVLLHEARKASHILENINAVIA